MPEHWTGTSEEWRAARDQFAKLEAEHAALDERITAQRRELPWVPVETEYVFDTEDGIIASWNGTANAITKVDNSAAGAVYKGLALVANAQGDFLLAANFRSGKIDVFDHNFQPAVLNGGTFTDPNLPAGYAPHGVHVVNNLVFVAYALQDTPKHDHQRQRDSRSQTHR